MKNILLLLAPLMLLVNFSCKKQCSDPICQLPPATQTGANTMGCLVNGQPWLPDVRGNWSLQQLKPINISFWNTTSEVLFRFYLYRSPYDQSLIIYIKDFLGTGIYTMDSTSRLIGLPGSNGTLRNHCHFSDYNFQAYYVTNEEFKGEIKVEFYDYSKKIISGTFHFKAQNINNPSDAISVTSGRFDCVMQ